MAQVVDTDAGDGALRDFPARRFESSRLLRSRLWVVRVEPADEPGPLFGAPFRALRVAKAPPVYAGRSGAEPAAFFPYPRKLVPFWPDVLTVALATYLLCSLGFYSCLLAPLDATAKTPACRCLRGDCDYSCGYRREAVCSRI